MSSIRFYFLPKVQYQAFILFNFRRFNFIILLLFSLYFNFEVIHLLTQYLCQLIN